MNVSIFSNNKIVSLFLPQLIIKEVKIKLQSLVIQKNNEFLLFLFSYLFSGW